VIQGPLFLASVSLLMTTQVGTPVAPPASELAKQEAQWRHAFAAGERFARARGGRVSFSLVDDQGQVHSHDGDSQYRSASVVKAMLLVAYLNQPRVANRPLDFGSRALLGPMITRSDNDAATRVHAIVGNPGLAEVARNAGMRAFATADAWGETRITANDQARFFARVDGLVPDRHRAYARELLASVIPAQRWGIAAAVPTWVRIYFKGGWRPDETGWLVHQVALVERGDRRVALAVLTDRDGSEGYGHESVEGVARRVLRPIARP
jgi:hypothetical protein